MFRRYSWPVEFVVRAIKETGWRGFSVNSALTPLTNMGQQLYEPPDVNGWELGAEWFSTASMLSRMNFAATLAANQQFNLAREAQPYRQSPERVLEFLIAAVPERGLHRRRLLGGAWTTCGPASRGPAADAQLQHQGRRRSRT